MSQLKLQEPFSQGVVIGRPRIGLRPGELTVAGECYYRPNDEGLHLLPEVEDMTPSPLSETCKGISYTERDDVALADLIWVAGTANVFYATADDSLSFSTIGAFPAGGVPASLETVQHGQSIYLLTGAPDIVKTTGDPATAANSIPAGFEPTTDRDMITASQITPGTWNPDSGPGIWWYWFTEYNPVHDIESGFTPPSQPFFTSNDDTDSASITWTGPQQNTYATHWRVYRSAQGVHLTASPTDSWDQFPTGYLISELPFSTTNFRDDGDPTFETPYPAVVIGSDAVPGISSQQNGTPPNKAFTGDMFENSLCVNDGRPTGIMRYSYPDAPYSWPDAYYINFETKSRDIITKIRALNNLLIVGMKETLWRVNTLPRATDAAFDRGRIADVISFNHGILNHKAADLYTTEDGVTQLAFVSRQGIFSTDGHTVTPLIRDIDFNGLIADEDQVVLRNFPSLHVLVMFYDDGTGTNNNKALFVHYHSSHRKEHGGYKVTGPHAISAYDAAYCHSDGQSLPSLYMLEDTAGAGGTEINRFGASDSSTDLHIRTRTIYLADFNTSVHILRAYLLHGAGSGDGTVTLYAENFGAAPTALTSGSFTPAAEAISEIEHERSVAGFALDITSPAPVYTVGIEHDPSELN